MTSTPAEHTHAYKRKRKRSSERARSKKNAEFKRVYNNSSVDTRRPIYLFVTQGESARRKKSYDCVCELTWIVRLLLRCILNIAGVLLRRMILYCNSLCCCVFFLLLSCRLRLLRIIIIIITPSDICRCIKLCGTNTSVVWLINRPNLTDWKTTLSDSITTSTFI